MKLTKHLMLSFAVAAATVTLASCSDDNAVINPAEAEENERVAELTAINKQYIEGTVYPTYELLADSTACLFDALHAIKLKLRHAPKTLTDAEVAEACETFLRARSIYETSEAFLYGAASDFGIDPHIDSWPLDLQGLAVALSNTAQIAAMDTYEEGGQDDPERFTGDTYAGEKLGQALLGFHGIEFILFREGRPRTAADLRGTDTYSGTTLAGRYAVSGLHEIIFATAVAGDLRNKCWQMEVSWNADAPADHIAKVEDMEWLYTLGGSGWSYGENFLRAGQQGSTYASVRKAIEAILVAGCANIADEVGMTKIGKPHTGEDVNYIESPYSYMSLVDFEDNILGIENAYMGGRVATHRGLAVPRARNLQSAEVQRGKQLFEEMGCATCHRPSWTTGEDNYWAPENIKAQGALPKYPRQVIYPYTDMLQHRLFMLNDIRTGWCRTTPLWGRGLSLQNTGADDRLHDCRARNVIEAIMWHGYSRESDAFGSTQKFYNLPKADRDAVVAFINAI